MLIDFNTTDGVLMPDINADLVCKWIVRVAEAHNRIVGRISYIFTDDEGIIDINRQFLKHDYYTDIITFDYSRRKLISGDLYISLDTVRTNAEMLGVSYSDELNRVIIHGILHLCGINDKGPGEREVMEDNENKSLDILKKMAQTVD